MSHNVIVDGKPMAVADVLADPVLSAVLTNEGPIKKIEMP
jgi:hypothetical protein